MHFAALNAGRLLLTRSEKRLAELLSITDVKPVILMLIWQMPVSEDGSRPIVVIGIWISIMCGGYLSNASKRKKIRRLLEDHMRENIIDEEQS